MSAAVEILAQCSCGGQECGGWQLLDSIGRVWPSGPLLSEFCAASTEGDWEPFTTQPQDGAATEPHLATGDDDAALFARYMGPGPTMPPGSTVVGGDIRSDLEAAIRNLGGWNG